MEIEIYPSGNLLILNTSLLANGMYYLDLNNEIAHSISRFLILR